MGLLHDEVATRPIEAHDPPVEEPALSEDSLEGHLPVIDEEVNIGVPGEIVERGKRKRHELWLGKVRSAADVVRAAVTTASNRDCQGFGRRTVEQRERRPRVNERLDRPLPIAVIELESDGGPSDVDDLAAGRDDAVFRPIWKGVVSRWARNYPAPTMKLVEGGATNWTTAPRP